MITSQELKIESKPTTDRQKPKVIKWKGVDMIRGHSFLSTVQEIVNFNSTIHVCRIGIIGDMHSGKTTLAEAMAHAIHKKAFPIPYSVRIFQKEELINFKETLSKLLPTNYILVFDDVSFLGAESNKKTIELIKLAVTKIRHLPGGQDVKIITIMNYHYTLGLDKYLRESDYRYFTTVGSSEKENMEKIFGTKYNNLVKFFKSLRQMGVTKGRFVLKIGTKEVFPYKFRDPFIPVLFFDEQSPRLIVTPTRHFMDPICSICTLGQKSEIDLTRFKEETDKKFPTTLFKLVIKQALKEQGLSTYSKGMVRARRYLDRALEAKAISLEELAVVYDIKVTNARLREKMDGVLA